MNIRIKIDKKLRIVNVKSIECKRRKCFIVGRYTHHSAAGLSGCSSWPDDDYRCLINANHGCPEIKREKLRGGKNE